MAVQSKGGKPDADREHRSRAPSRSALRPAGGSAGGRGGSGDARQRSASVRGTPEDTREISAENTGRKVNRPPRSPDSRDSSPDGPVDSQGRLRTNLTGASGNPGASDDRSVCKDCKCELVENKSYKSGDGSTFWVTLDGHKIHKSGKRDYYCYPCLDKRDSFEYFPEVHFASSR